MSVKGAGQGYYVSSVGKGSHGETGPIAQPTGSPPSPAQVRLQTIAAMDGEIAFLQLRIEELKRMLRQLREISG